MLGRCFASAMTAAFRRTTRSLAGWVQNRKSTPTGTATHTDLSFIRKLISCGKPNWSDGWRRDQCAHPREELRLATRIDGTQLHWNIRVRPALVPPGNGESANVLGSVDQPV